VVSSLVAFVAVSVAVFLLAHVLLGGIVWPTVIGIFFGFAAATVLNAAGIMARWSGRQRDHGRDEADRGRDDVRRGRDDHAP
jgi:hypothetical protein